MNRGPRRSEKEALSRFPQELQIDRNPSTGKAVPGLINLDASDTGDSLLWRRRTERHALAEPEGDKDPASRDTEIDKNSKRPEGIAKKTPATVSPHFGVDDTCGRWVSRLPLAAAPEKEQTVRHTEHYQVPVDNSGRRHLLSS